MTNPKNGGNMALNWENEEEDLDTLSPLDEEGDEEGELSMNIFASLWIGDKRPSVSINS